MLSNIRRMVLVPAIAVAICGLLGSSAVAANQFTGAIYTTNFRGDTVNQNHFTLKEAVFLNGGPQHPGGPQLPLGHYYFQVTDPNGRTLLSTDDAVCRQVVVGPLGKVNAVVPASGCEHLLGSDGFPGDPRPNDTPVQLFPFDSAPNKGGTYKVWMIAQGDAVSGCNPVRNGRFLNFAGGCSKTDNFKVESQSQPACAAWEDNFDGTALDLTRWVVESGPAPGSIPDQFNFGTFDPTYVSVAGGYLTLKLTQLLDGSLWRSTGALIHTQVPCGYGTFEWTMRMGSSTNGPSSTGTNLSGGVSSGFTYWNNSENEINFEHTAHTAIPPASLYSPESIWFVNFRNQDPQNRDPLDSEGTATEYGLIPPAYPPGDVYNNFHQYKFVWIPGSITFYIDGVVKDVHTTNVPVVPGLLMISYYGRNFPLWGGVATGGTRYFFVTHVSYTPMP